VFSVAIDKLKLRRLVKQLEQLGKKTATKILVDELKTTAKQTMVYIKPLVPKRSGRLKRSLAMKRVKKKRRYDVAFRIFFKPITTTLTTSTGRKIKVKEKFYGFAPEYGVSKGRGKQAAQGMIHAHGKKYAEGLRAATYGRIKRRIQQAWQQAK
jgi:hypothetical protein